MKLNKLTALAVSRAKPGRYGDGGGRLSARFIDDRASFGIGWMVL